MWRLTMGLLAVALCAPRTLAEPLPLEHFTRYDESGTIKISPDGTHFAVTAGRYGRSNLQFVRIKDRKVVGGLGLVDRDEIEDFEWVSSERVVYFLARPRPDEARANPSGEIGAVDRDGTDHRLIYGFRAGNQQTGTRLAEREDSFAKARLISSLPDDDRHILIAEYPYKRLADSFYFDIRASTSTSMWRLPRRTSCAQRVNGSIRGPCVPCSR